MMLRSPWQGRVLTAFLCSLCLGSSCPQTTTPDDQPASQGRVLAVHGSRSLEIHLEAELPPLSLAATVEVSGTTISAPGSVVGVAGDRDLMRQKVDDGRILRFAISDSRALRIPRRGLIFRIPLQGQASHAVIKDVSAADEGGRRIILQGYDGPPGGTP